MAVIQKIPFDNKTPDRAKMIQYGENWPVVYVINDKREAYVGETVNFAVRSMQHLKNPERNKLDEITIISDDTFNKSVILDLESYLIGYMAADGKYTLQNSTMGIQAHDYYNRAEYEQRFSEIWQQLKSQNLATNTISYIENSDIFKFSPYKALTLDQYKVVDEVVEHLANSFAKNENQSIVVRGGAGTGKSVLAIYLMKLLADTSVGIFPVDTEVDSGINYIIENLKRLPKLKIGLVVPMQSLRFTVKNVFKSIHGLKASMVLSPIEVPNEFYDVLIVDEAHRLRQRKALAQYPSFDKNNKKLGLDNSGTELDWILKCSKNQVFFYDDVQTVKPSDVSKTKFDWLIKKGNTVLCTLESQLRCKGGNDYIEYIKQIFSCVPPKESKSFGNYDLKLYDNVEDMVSAIKQKESEVGLCRVVAGYSWKWLSKEDKTQKDILIGNSALQWNSVNKDWVNSDNSINEVGCIHTIQGYDLNYAGVIFGNEIKYDEKKQCIVIDKSQYKDLQGKTALKNDDELKEYIVNIYVTLLSRGIKGTYMYACDEGLRNYLYRYF